jgi:hypothetical protein
MRTIGLVNTLTGLWVAAGVSIAVGVLGSFFVVGMYAGHVWNLSGATAAYVAIGLMLGGCALGILLLLGSSIRLIQLIERKDEENLKERIKEAPPKHYPRKMPTQITSINQKEPCNEHIKDVHL